MTRINEVIAALEHGCVLARGWTGWWLADARGTLIEEVDADLVEDLIVVEAIRQVDEVITRHGETFALNTWRKRGANG